MLTSRTKRAVAAVLALVVLGLSAPSWAADDAAISEIRADWQACSTALNDAPEAWIGWRRDFLNGYGDNFQFHDNRLLDQPSVLVREISTDAIFYETITSCFRTDGTLAFIYTEALSPNYAQGGDNGPLIKREGRIYFDRAGEVIRTLGQITDADEGVLVKNGVDTDTYSLARGCAPVVVHKTLDEVEAEYFSVLGDIEGNHPEFTRATYDWCAAVAR